MEKNYEVITSIKQQKNPKRYNVYLNETYSFAVHEDVLVKFELRKGKEVDKRDIESVLKAEEQHRAEWYALQYLGYQARTKDQIRKHLQKKGFEEEDSEVVLRSLIEKNYINDEAYAQQWIEERKRTRPRGRHLLKKELMQRGIEKSVIENMVKNYVSDKEELEMMTQLINKRWRGKTFTNSLEAKKKMVPFLQRKGFASNLVFKLVDEASEEFIEQEETL